MTEKLTCGRLSTCELCSRCLLHHLLDSLLDCSKSRLDSVAFLILTYLLRRERPFRVAHKKNTPKDRAAPRRGSPQRTHLRSEVSFLRK